MHRCVAEAMEQHTRLPTCERAKQVAPLAHGWKHSASMFMLPVYVAMFGDRFLFVHIVRDGRDLVLSINRATAKRYRHFCGSSARPQLAGGCRRANDTLLQRKSSRGALLDQGALLGNPKITLQVWAAANLGVTRLGRRLLGERYTLVRAEDFIVADEAVRTAAATRLLVQLRLRPEVPLAPLLEVFRKRIGVANIRASAIGRNSSFVYSGKWRTSIAPKCMHEMLALPLVCEAMHEY
mmetsp:Transcript_24912/g.57593  ORF Transcript_24912/g.57593 Transcript_24912/m.57593 type:complete len:238 (+) Transcript_24912:866-1579(+)